MYNNKAQHESGVHVSTKKKPQKLLGVLMWSVLLEFEILNSGKNLPKFQVNFWWIYPSPWSIQWPQNFETNLQKSSCWFEAIGKMCLSNWIISPGRCENKKYLKPSTRSLFEFEKNHFKIPKWQGCFFPIRSHWWRSHSYFTRNCPTFQ